jgi:SAM-dependent methyltransferase
MLGRGLKESFYSSLWRLSPRVPFTRLNIVCKEIRNLSTEGTILDLGCGTGKTTALILDRVRKKFRVTGVDASKLDIKEAEGAGIYEKLFLADVREFQFMDKAFDIIILLEVLEHIPKEEGLELLARMEATARKGVIVTTPAYLDRPRKGTEAEDVAFFTSLYKNEPHKMPHISVWKPEEYQRLGYSVRASGVHITHLPDSINLVLTAFLAPFVYYFFSSLASSLVAVKRIVLTGGRSENLPDK